MRGLTCSAFPAGVFVFPSNQLLERLTHIKPTFTITNKTNHESNILINGSFFISSKILLS
ncbi:hypothetical protein FA002_18235 [Priestia megaterium]|nr:hypothetical protein CJ194_06060 [Priestia megaterium]TJZ36096.1 hypothetical protein FA002_18235 [Priestia megaterium]